MKHLSAISLALVAGLGAQAQLTVTNNLPVSSVAQLLEGFNVTISNVVVNCPGAALGHFTGTSELYITEGLVLTTGMAANVAGSADLFATEMLGTPGDADLDMLVQPYPTYDACVLEFDCVPNGDTLLFNFSFGSEEYPEFVMSAFNDVFSILLSGPGFPYPTNVAALPDATPVAINNVNAQVNAGYFHDNSLPPGQFIAYDGFTTNLTAFAVVEPDGDYHFKVAIADVGDGVFDSGVFLEAFSFRSTEISTGVADVAKPALRLSRNGEQFTVELPENAANQQLVITGVTGNVIKSLRVSGDRCTIDLAGVTTGVYTLRVLGVQGLAPVRFVKD